jgi:hypothetical protein
MSLDPDARSLLCPNGHSTSASLPYSLTGLFSNADASSLPYGEKAVVWIVLEWPSSICSAAPKLVCHSLTVLSSDADASSLPSSEKATALTRSPLKLVSNGLIVLDQIQVA